MPSQRKAELTLVLVTLIAGAGWIFSKQAIQGLPAFGFIGIRFVLASLCLLPLCYRALIKTHPKDIAKALSVGLILGCSLLLWIYAISVSPTLGEGAFIMSLSMLLMPMRYSVQSMPRADIPIKTSQQSPSGTSQGWPKPCWR